MSIVTRINDNNRALFDVDDDPVYKSLVCNKNGAVPAIITKPDQITIGAIASQVEYLRKLSIELIKQLYINTASGEFLKYQLETFFNSLRAEDETDAAWVQRTIQIVFYPKLSRAAIIFALRPYSPGHDAVITTVEEKSGYADFSFAGVYIEGQSVNPGPDNYNIVVLPAIAEAYDSSYYTIQIDLYDTNLADIYNIMDLLDRIITAGITYKLRINYT
jgi:hypothetical protein